MLAVAGNAESEDGRRGRDSAADKRRDTRGAHASTLAGEPGPGRTHRRSIYLQMKRSLTLPMLQIFDAPDTATSCAAAREFHRGAAGTGTDEQRVQLGAGGAVRGPDSKQAGENPEASVEAGWRLAFGRPPTAEERQTALDYLSGIPCRGCVC